MREIERDIFANATLKAGSLEAFGFHKEGDVYRLSRTLPSSGLEVKITIDGQGEVEGKVYDDGEEFEGFRHQVLGEYSAAIKEEFVALLREIRDFCYVLHRPVEHYLVPSNPRIYDIDRGFKENDDVLDWPAKKRLHEGDVIYIYSALPFKGIKFRCKVLGVLDVADYHKGRPYFSTLIHREETYAQGEYPLDECLKHGLKTVRFFHKVNDEFVAYMEKETPPKRG